MTSVSDSSFCLTQIARTEAAKNNITTGRFEKISPYGGVFTDFDFSMRRKAEVLKFSPSVQTTQTNNLNKRQQFAQNISRRISISNISEKYVKQITTRAITLSSACKSSIDNPTAVSDPMPSSRSDVPGKTDLYYDPSVPLYLFKGNQGPP